MDELELRALLLVREEVKALGGFGSSMCGAESADVRKATALKMSERHMRILGWLNAVIARHAQEVSHG